MSDQPDRRRGNRIAVGCFLAAVLTSLVVGGLWLWLVHWLKDVKLPNH